MAPSFGGYCGEERLGRDGRFEIWGFYICIFGEKFGLGILLNFFSISFDGVLLN